MPGFEALTGALDDFGFEALTCALDDFGLKHSLVLWMILDLKIT
jgi:hypothetical protein